MRQAIETKYLGPTNFRGSRVKAKCGAGTFILNWDSELDPGENHVLAAETLFKHLGWDKDGKGNKAFKLVGGALPKPHTGYCFVMVGIK